MYRLQHLDDVAVGTPVEVVDADDEGVFHFFRTPILNHVQQNLPVRVFRETSSRRPSEEYNSIFGTEIPPLRATTNGQKHAEY